MYKRSLISSSAIAFTFLTSVANANTSVKECVMQAYSYGDENMTLADIRTLCHVNMVVNENIEIATLSIAPGSTRPVGVISSRIIKERQMEFEPYVITPHKINYILPVITTNTINKTPYSNFDGYQDNLEDIEAKFQLSFKVPLNYDSIFVEGDGFYFGFTIQAWWQIYADNISKPFRETNYQPEVFYLAPLNWHPFGGNTGIVFGIEHQSNGRAQNLSRSWNRMFANLLYEKNNFAISLRPWLRLGETKKAFPLDPAGDDNPDIEDFLGRYELAAVYKYKDMEFSVEGRHNFSSKKGSAEFGLTFPLWGKLRGYATAFSGYGESLIDYNYSQTRFGLGVALNNVL